MTKLSDASEIRAASKIRGAGKIRGASKIRGAGKKRDRNVALFIVASAAIAACVSMAIDNHHSSKVRVAGQGQNL